MRILVLDDDQARHDVFRENLDGHDVTHVLSFEAACKAVTDSEKFDVFFLDHDLMDFHYASSGYMSPQPFEHTGYHFVRWMIDDMPEALRPELVVVHSWNPDGAIRMTQALRAAGFNFHREEFGMNIGLNLKDNR